MRTINEIITETINNFILKEKATSVIYHFTSIVPTLKICRDNRFVLSESITKVADSLHKSKMFYLSTTRLFNGEVGYSRGRNVRIELDGDKLNQRYQATPVNYWGDRSMSEYEDRIISKEPIIPNADQYIRKITVLLDSTHPTQAEYEKSMAYNLLLCAKSKGIQVDIFDNKKDFNNPRSTNTINAEIETHSEYFGKNPERFEYKRKIETLLCDVMNFCTILENVDYDNIPKYIATMLKTYGLSEYATKTIKYVIAQAYKYCPGLPNIYLKDSYGTDEYITICTILRDVLNKYGLKNVVEADRYVRGRRNQNSNTNNYDYDKTIQMLCFTTGYRNIAIVDPNNTPFWSIFNEQDAKNFKYNMMERLTNHDEYYGVRSHSSKNNEYFNKFIKHLTMSPNITVTQMINYLNKIDYAGDVFDDIFYGHFVTKEISYWDTWKVANNEQEEQKIKELFKAN